MTTSQVLFAGGTGIVGRTAVRWFHERHPDVPVLVAGRDMHAAAEITRDVRTATAVTIDLDKPQLGIGPGADIAAVVMLAPDNGLHGLNYAQDLGVPYVNINNGLVDVAPEMALFAHRAHAAPVVLASHWLGGAALFLALNSTRAFETVHSLRIGALLDANDAAGPAALEDMERVHAGATTALAFHGGRRLWLTGDTARRKIETVDGRSLEAEAFSTLDTPSLYAATGAPDIRFDLMSGISSSRRRGDDVATEIIVDIEGESDGRAKHSRSTLEFTPGAASLTGLSVALILSEVLGLNDSDPARPGLYTPELLTHAPWFVDQLSSAGATIQDSSE